MSENAKQSLGVPGADGSKTNSKRKMTAAIIEDQEKEAEVYEFLEEDDDFEEFENGAEYDDLLTAGQVDSQMAAGAADSVVKKMWQQDWDDEEPDDDFGATLKAQLGMR